MPLMSLISWVRFLLLLICINNTLHIFFRSMNTEKYIKSLHRSIFILQSTDFFHVLRFKKTTLYTPSLRPMNTEQCTQTLTSLMFHLVIN